MGVGTSSIQDLTVEEVISKIGEYFLVRRLTLQDAFCYLDVDRSGYISFDELLRGLRACLEGMGGNTVLTSEGLMPIFERFDTNKDGLLSIQEFSLAFAPSTAVSKACFDNACQSIQHNPSYDAISQAEFRTATDLITRIATSLNRMGYTPQQLFAKIDRDHNGWISREELEGVVLRFEPELSPSERDLIFNLLDRDKDGRLELSELISKFEGVSARAFASVEDVMKVFCKRFSQQGKTVAEAFRVFDRNNDGFLSREEWRRSMGLLGPEISAADADAVFMHFDMNQDGFMSIHEFSAFFTTTISRTPPVRTETPLPGMETPLPGTANPLPGTTPLLPGTTTLLPGTQPFEAVWEKDILDLIRSCFKERSGGMPITEVFRRLNYTGSNSLSMAEFSRMVLTYRPDLTVNQVESLFYKVNLTRSDGISIGEFVQRFG
jgi:Ca2+-binding EF-hand superfamily protein